MVKSKKGIYLFGFIIFFIMIAIISSFQPVKARAETEETPIIYQSENMSINFSGIKEIVEEDYTFYEKYVDKTKWFIGTEVTLPRYNSNKPKNYVEFTNSTANSFFGPKKRYTEFICRFSVTVTKDSKEVSTGTRIGISFGKEYREEPATEAPSIAFEKTSSGMAVRNLNCKAVETNTAYNLWSSNDVENASVTYRIMIVVKGGEIRLYYAPTTADAAEMTVCRGVFSTTKTDGFITVFGLRGADFALNDFAVTNLLNSTTALDRKEALSVDFSSKEEYTQTGKVSKTKNGIQLSANGAVSIKETFENAIVYTDVAKISGDKLQLSIGQQSISLTRQGDVTSSMQVLESAEKSSLEGLFDGGKLIAQKMGGKVYLSWTEGNGDLKEFPIAVFKDETAGAVAFSVGAGDGTSVEMESIRLFGLQPTVEILADDWEEMDGKRPEKSPPPQKENNEKSGCSSTAGLSGVVVLAAGAACMLKKKKGNHNED